MSGAQIVDGKSGPPSPKKSSAGAIAGVAAGLVVVVAVAVGVASASGSSSSPDAPPTPAVPAVDLDFSSVTANGSGSRAASASAVSVEAPAPKAKPKAEFHFHNTRSSSGSTFYVLGFVENTGEVPIDKPKLHVVLKDKDGKEVATDFGFGTRDITYPGEKTPVNALVKDPPPYDSMEFELELGEPFYVPKTVEGLEVVDPKITRAKYGSGYEAEGKVSHSGSVPAKFVEVECQAYNAEGKLVGIYTTYASGDVLEPGATARFKFLGFYFDEEPAKYDFFVNGRPAEG